MGTRTMRVTTVLCALACVLVVHAQYSSESDSDTVERKVHFVGDSADGPRLHLVENFATDEEMDLIMKSAFENMRPQNQKAETGIVHELPVGSSPVFQNVYRRMSSVFPGIGKSHVGPGENHDTFRVRRYLQDGEGYQGGDYHPPHTDWFSSTPGDTSHVLIISMILYLTIPENGGTTYFPRSIVNGTQGYHFKPKRGNLAAWWSCHRNGTQDFDSSHESTPVLEGIKWNAARFFYDNTNKCASPAANTIRVPKAADALKDMGHSSDSMYGTSMPDGVVASPEGTSHIDGQNRVWSSDPDYGKKGRKRKSAP